MPQNDIFKRYIDAGLEFTMLTQSRAEALVRDLVKAGEVQADQARDAVADIVERSRKNSEKLLATVRKEVRSQITGLGLASQADLDRIEARIASVLGAAAAPVKKTVAKRAPAKKAPPKKAAAAKRPAAKKPAATKAAPAKKSVKKG